MLDPTAKANQLIASECVQCWPLVTRKLQGFLVATKTHESTDDKRIWEAILADLTFLAQEGFEDPEGSKRSFMLLFAKGDEEKRSVGWGLCSYSSGSPCSECLCNRSSLPYTDLGPQARWRPTESMSKEAYISRIRGDPTHPLATCQFVTRLSFNWA